MSSPQTQTPPRAQGDGQAGEAPAPGQGGEMAFLDHLEELRWALLKGLGGIVAITIACAFVSEWILREILLGPTEPDFFMYDLLRIDAQSIQLLNRTITGQFFAHIGAIAGVGVVIGSPVLIYFLWRFLEPALYPHEKKGMRFAAGFASFFFILGVAFGYLVLTPLALQFFESYRISPQIVNRFDITKYFTMLVQWSLGCGLLFELPVAVYFLTKIGLLTPSVLRKYRRHALIVILFLAAVVTPPDPVSQVIVAIPLYLLYELSIQIAKVVDRRRRNKLAEIREGE